VTCESDLSSRAKCSRSTDSLAVGVGPSCQLFLSPDALAHATPDAIADRLPRVGFATGFARSVKSDLYHNMSIESCGSGAVRSP
jgi:hypothetical protein